MTYRIREIESIGNATAEKLEKAGIATVEELLQKAHSRAGRKEVAEKSGLSEEKILNFVNMGDLMRVKGVGGEFAELLMHAGVDTVKEFRNRKAENLQPKLVEVNAEKKLTRRVPNEEMLRQFIENAKELEPMVTH